MTTKTSRIHLWVVLGLMALFFAQCLTASLKKSPTYDEPVHMIAGLSYVETGRIGFAPEQAPLLREMSGLTLRAAGIRLPKGSESLTVIKGDSRAKFPVAYDLLLRLFREHGADRVMFWARLPLLLLATCLAGGVYLLGRALIGPRAGVGALVLFALDPNLIAHSYLVTTDVGVTAFSVLFVIALWFFFREPRIRNAIWCGLPLGAALGSKFSAVVLLPVALALAIAAALWAEEPERPLKRKGRGRGAVRESAGHATSPAARLKSYAVGLAVVVGVAYVAVQLVYLLPNNPLQYVTGLRLVNADHNPDALAYMAGELKPRFYSYYVVAILLKEPLATIVLFGAGMVLLIRSASLPRLARVFLLLPPAAFLLGYSLFSDNLGIRYVIPVLPFIFVIGGWALESSLRSARRWMRASGVVLAGWLGVAAIGIYPDHLSYFNEAACLLDAPRSVGWDGGSRCGPSWLDDSNVDWGQGLKQLKAWLDENAAGRTVRLGQFGHFPPEAYGIKYERITDADLLTGSRPGLYAISAHIVASTPAIAKRSRGSGAEWLRDRKPVAIVGHAYYIFDVPERAPDKADTIR